MKAAELPFRDAKGDGRKGGLTLDLYPGVKDVYLMQAAEKHTHRTLIARAKAEDLRAAAELFKKVADELDRARDEDGRKEDMVE